MPKSHDFDSLSRRLRTLLISQGTLPAREACALMQVSQPTFSRLVERMGNQLLVYGKARSTHYALRRRIEGLSEEIPLYVIAADGKPSLLASLHPAEPRGFVIEWRKPVAARSYYPDLPYFFDDLRPSGYLGRFVPLAHPELGAPRDIQAWSADDCLRYWCRWGSNGVGNLILGEAALARFLERRQAKAPKARDFPELARSALALGDAGSSAGGEQPKFALEASGKEAASLIKFSPPLRDPIGRRVGDLLVCEHLCLEVLSKHRISSAKSRVVEAGNQLFLRVERFDRVGRFGRRGVVSLRALGMEFVGAQDRWRRISAGLVRAKKIAPATHDSVRELELFGELIGNTDMHPGNLSFYVDDSLGIAGLAPVYDMLPMMYYPRQNQLMDKAYAPALPSPEDAAAWKKACALAL
jgi:hypothetical protein